MKNPMLSVFCLISALNLNSQNVKDSIPQKRNFNYYFLNSVLYSGSSNFKLNTDLTINNLANIPTNGIGFYSALEGDFKNISLDFRYSGAYNNNNKYNKLFTHTFGINLGYKIIIDKKTYIQPYVGFNSNVYKIKLNVFNDNKSIIVNNINSSNASLLELNLKTYNVNGGLKFSFDNFNIFGIYSFQLINANWSSDFNSIIGFPSEKINYFQCGIEFALNLRKK